MSEPISLPDLAAFGDVLADVAAETEGASLPRLLELEGALGAVISDARDVAALIHAAILNATREPVRIGDQILHAEPVGKWRPDHTAIRKAIVVRALVDDNGELAGDPATADRAVDLAYACFVSPSTMPKRRGLDALGKASRDVAEWEHTGFELQREQIGGTPE